MVASHEDSGGGLNRADLLKAAGTGLVAIVVGREAHTSAAAISVAEAKRPKADVLLDVTDKRLKKIESEIKGLVRNGGHIGHAHMQEYTFNGEPSKLYVVNEVVADPNNPSSNTRLQLVVNVVPGQDQPASMFMIMGAPSDKFEPKAPVTGIGSVTRDPSEPRYLVRETQFLPHEILILEPSYLFHGSPDSRVSQIEPILNDLTLGALSMLGRVSASSHLTA